MGHNSRMSRTAPLRELYLWARELLVRQLTHGRAAGQGMAEYALILSFIAVVVLVILTVAGKQVNNVFSNVSNGLAH